jgi:hypothetical protein
VAAEIIGGPGFSAGFAPGEGLLDDLDLDDRSAVVAADPQ